MGSANGFLFAKYWKSQKYQGFNALVTLTGLLKYLSSVFLGLKVVVSSDCFSCNRKNYFHNFCGGCGPMGRVGHLVIGRSPVRIPAPPTCMLKCPWARYWTPKLLLTSSWRLAWQPSSSVYECVYECGMYCTALWAVVRLEKGYKNADHLPFITHMKTWQISVGYTCMEFPFAKIIEWN